MTTYQSKQHETPASKAQARLLALIGTSCPASYEAAASLLEDAKMRRDAIPFGGTWRSAAKMTDSELLNACKVAIETETVIDRY